MLNHFRRNNGIERIFMDQQLPRIVLNAKPIEWNIGIGSSRKLNSFVIVFNADRVIAR